MRLDNVVTVAKREYLTRIKTKAFWIGTILLPLLMGVATVVPGLVMAKTRSSQRLAVVDRTGSVAGPLVAALAEGFHGDTAGVRFDVRVVSPRSDAAAQRRELDRLVLAGKLDAWVWIDSKGLAGDKVEYHAESVSNFLTQAALERALSRVVRERRLAAAGYDWKKIAELSRPVDLGTVRISEAGSRAEAGLGGFALAFALFFMLYMVIVIYGQQVMQGVLEEKSSRIVEVIVSAVAPLEMMAGKLAGIGLLGLTQLGIWIGTAVVLTAPGLLGALAFLPAGVSLPTIPPVVVLHAFLFFLLGYFLFASFYAMLGSAFNNLQEAQQFAGVAIIFLVGPFMLLMPVINDPDSTLAVVASLIPPFTPLLMMLRVAVKMPPAWQLLLGYALTIAFTCGVVWVASRIYRVGILMYGKKPTLLELWRWVRYR